MLLWLARLTVVVLLVYAVIQRRLRLALRDHDRHIPGNKGQTAIPTAAVVFALFTLVTLVHFAVDHASILHVHNIREDPLIVCEAVGIAQAWDQGRQRGKTAVVRSRCSCAHRLPDYAAVAASATKMAGQRQG